MEKAIIKASKRSVTGKQVHALRRAGQLPGVLYGHNVEATAISMDDRETSRILAKLTSSSLVDVELEGKTYPALVREKQRNFIKGSLLHVDFQVISLTEKIRTSVGIELTGASAAVKDYNAVLVTPLNELEVECFPQDLPERIIVDISVLTQIGNGIRVSDLQLSDKLQIHTALDEMVVIATAPKIEEVAETVEAVEEVAEPEVIERGKKEEEVPEEGTGAKSS